MPPAPEKTFKLAPPKFSKELAENGSDDPEPDYLRQYILGDRAIEHRRKGELALWASMGVTVGGCIAVFGLFVPVLWVVAACVVVAAATGARGAWLLYDSKVADMQSRALVAQGEMKIRVLSDEEVAQREIESQKTAEMNAKARAARANGNAVA